jgi:hypothetical protein
MTTTEQPQTGRMDDRSPIAAAASIGLWGWLIVIAVAAPITYFS